MKNKSEKPVDHYPYKVLHSNFTPKEISDIKQKLSRQFGKVTKSWSDEKNSEWLIRTYLSMKMIFSASVMLTSLDYARKKNLKIVESYLSYYALLCCCRSVDLLFPENEWNNGKIITRRHKKIITDVCKKIKEFNSEKGSELNEFIFKVKNTRELFSYKFPASGSDNFLIDYDELIEQCTLLVEIAQIYSFELEKSFTKNIDVESSVFSEEILWKGSCYLDGSYVDEDDHQRVSCLAARQKRPYNLYSSMTEGQVEDFFGAWCCLSNKSTDAEHVDVYNPDVNWQIIFQIP